MNMKRAFLEVTLTTVLLLGLQTAPAAGLPVAVGCFLPAPFGTSCGGTFCFQIQDFPLLGTTSSSEGYQAGREPCGVNIFGVACGQKVGIGACESGGGSETGCDCGPGLGPCVTSTPTPEGPTASLAEVFNRPVEKPIQTEVIAKHLEEIARAGLPADLAAYWQELASLPAIHFRAEVETWKSDPTRPGHATVGAGLYEYWDDGERFRVSSRVPEALGLSLVGDLALDGFRYQTQMLGSGILTVSTKDSRLYPAALRNPLFLPVLFLSSFDDTCPRCELRLSDLHAVKPIANQAPVKRGERVLTTPAVQFGGIPVAGYRVKNWDAPHERVTVIERLGATGVVLERVELSFFNSVPGNVQLRFPWTLVHSINDEHGNALIRNTYKIEFLETKRSFPDSVFRLEPVPGQRVWDNDRKQYLQ